MANLFRCGSNQNSNLVNLGTAEQLADKYKMYCVIIQRTTSITLARNVDMMLIFSANSDATKTITSNSSSAKVKSITKSNVDGDSNYWYNNDIQSNTENVSYSISDLKAGDTISGFVSSAVYNGYIFIKR